MKRLILIPIILLSLFHLKAQTFEEVSDQVGLDYYYPGHHRQEVGAGITVVDINNDGWDDLFQSGGCFSSKVWINNEGVFTDKTDEYLPDSLKYRFIQGAISSDFDNDGFVDLILTNMSFFNGDQKSPVLLKNIDGKSFKQFDVPELDVIGHFPGASWGDVNKDGFVDLYVLNYVERMINGFDSIENHSTYIPTCLPNLFLINHNGQHFEELSHQYGVDNEGCGLASMFTDIDNDNDIDIILLNDFGQWNHLGNRVFLNNYPKASFTDATDSLGFSSEFYGMGVGVGDLDYDAQFEYYFTNIGDNYLFQRREGKFENVAKEMRVDLGRLYNKKSTSWTGIFLDVDNDMDMDLFVAKGYLESIESPSVIDYNKLMINEDGYFVDHSISSGIYDSIPSRGAAYFDFDHDGDLDIVVNTLQLGRGEFANATQKIKLYENKTKNKNRWLGIKLIGTDGVNTSAVGCSVKFRIGDKWYVREVDGGSGHSSQSTKTLYFGVGKNKKIEEIEIHWINAETTKIHNVKTNKCYRVGPKGVESILY